MKRVQRTNEQGVMYLQYKPECPADYPQFDTQEQKDKLIQAVQNHYADGKLVRGRQMDGHGGHCIMGIVNTLNMWEIFGSRVNFSITDDITMLLVCTNNDGPGSYSPSSWSGDESVDNTVTPKSYSELMMILKDSPVGEEK